MTPDAALAGRVEGEVNDLITLTGDPAQVATIADFGAAALGARVNGGDDFRAAEALGEAVRGKLILIPG